MSDQEKLSWLMLGRAPEGLGQDDMALLQQAAIGADENLRLQIGLFPDRDGDDITGLQPVGRQVHPGRTHADLGLFGQARSGEHGQHECDENAL